jgi:tRNA U34 2-thiouridine synthase MnmA/TrmU
VRLTDHTWVGEPHVGLIDAQISAHGEPAAAQLNSDGSMHWFKTRRKVAPGQAVVFYLNDAVVGGATAG